MESLENIQPEERLEGSEAVESVEEQTLQEATHEPGARVEETQSFEQAEAIEEELTKSVESVEMVDVETQERLAAQEDGGQDGGDAATPIVIPDVQQEADAQQVGMEFDPIPDPPPEGQVARDTGTGGMVAEVPEPGGNPPGPNLVADDGSELMKDDQGGRPSGDVSATPINLPNEANAVEGGQGGRPGGDVSATPINVPSPVENQVEGDEGDQVAHEDHWSEMPDPGEDPPPPNQKGNTPA